MKKITAFFMAIMPIFITALLFISGMIVKSYVHVGVSAVEVVNNSVVKNVRDFEKEKPTIQLETNVLPQNASNPALFYKSSNPDIAEVDSEGLITCKAYGDVYIYAFADENETINDKCKLEITDTIYHDIKINNKDTISYVDAAQLNKLDIVTQPTATYVTHPDLTYTSDKPQIIQVNSDGLLIPQTDSSNEEVTITVESKAENSINGLKDEVKVKLGPGVSLMDIDNRDEEVLSNPTGYNLYQHIKTSPESISNLLATNFNYSCDDTSVAEIDESGNVKFSQAGEVTFTATYKRDATKKVSKKIKCTYDKFVDVSFTNNEYSTTIDQIQDGKIDPSKLDYSLFPLQTQKSENVSVESSNIDVIVPQWNPTTSKYEFLVKGAGTALVTVTVKTESEEVPVKSDSCLITIGLDKNQIVKSDTVTLNDTYYYALRNNINANMKYAADQKVEFELTSGSDVAYIDNDELLHFTEPGTATITVTATFGDETETKDFTVKCEESLVEIDINKPIPALKAGQRCTIKSSEGFKPTFDGCSDKFDITDSNTYFIAKHGCSFQHFELSNGTTTKEIAITFSEDPLYVSSNKKSLETVTNDEYSPIDFKQWASPTIFPSTALKTDGSAYALTYKYKPQTDGIATIEGDTITFLAPGTVIATVSWDDQHVYDYRIKSTWGKLGRINVFKRTGITTYDEQIYSGTQQVIAPNEVLELRTNTMHYSEFTQIKYSTLNNLCTVELQTSATELVKRHAYITIKPKENVYGNDVVKLETGSYIFYINVHISPDIQTIKVLNNGQELSSKTKTYTKNLKNLQIIIGPSSAKTKTYTVEFNGTEITPTIGSVYDTLDLSGQTWKENDENTLVFTSNGKVVGNYSITYSTATPTIIVDGSTEFQDENNETKKGIFLGANSNQRSLQLKSDGFVESNFWQDFTASLESTESGETATITGNLLSLTKIPSTSLDDPYSNTLQIKKAGAVVDTYVIGRDYITQIVLPKHDNRDETDKKGMQKVHVYGIESFYNPKEGLIDYYKLPIEIYDNNHKLIGDDTEQGKQLKKLAYSTLTTSINNNAEAKYDDEGFIKIYFNKTNYYSDEEIFNNTFDSQEQGKKVTYDVHTKSTQIDANYTFVPVKGVNCYCQEGLKQSFNHYTGAVLQTNFGLQGVEKDNMPLTDDSIDCLLVLYGNGYSIDFNAMAEQSIGKNLKIIDIKCIFNAIIMGCHTNDFSRGQLIELAQTISYCQAWQKSLGISYSIIKNFTKPSDYHGAYDINPIIKNTIFTNNLEGSLIIDGSNEEAKSHPLYIENCAFLNAGSFPIEAVMGRPIYFKGNMPIYCFYNKEMLANFFGQDLRFLWPALLKAAQNSHMTQVGADGSEYVNSFMATGLNDQTYFYNPATGQYEKGFAGREGAVNHMSKYVDIRIPFPSSEGWITIEAGMWASVNPNHEIGAPDYWEAYDKEGNMKQGFFNTQVRKLCREIYFF